VLWWLEGGARLGALSRDSIADPMNEVAVSAASVWEIEVKRTAGRLNAPSDLLEMLERSAMRALPITAEHASIAGRLDGHHADPFDRMIVAQAQREGLVLITRDRRLMRYPIATMPA
jgi:PIN domain nuclease of toxin-antitoxin system